MIQICKKCDQPTGRCVDQIIWGSEDIVVCEECHKELEREYRCRDCDGIGTVDLWRDKHGNIDYLRGQPSGHRICCQRCKGEGIVI
jgi:hypothetical protein